MPVVDIADDTFLTVPPEVAASTLGDERRWAGWWPGLLLRVEEDRGTEGVRWRVDGPLVGTMEVWLEPVLDGTVLHYFLRADPVVPSWWPTALLPLAHAVARDRWRARGRAVALAVRGELDGTRPPGVDPARRTGGGGQPERG
ncbi:hypothetical protein [Actinoalloteichus caeruleus]|uniref:hypothetical protein n=1 Tax=Actinoalloteichus cyanogriseus TaxID=2893586 RepID=UPI000558AB62|nr:hypothetical protein [Actinoalloteichus caeruleus]